jgi:hypothetical protein
MPPAALADCDERRLPADGQMSWSTKPVGEAAATEGRSSLARGRAAETLLNWQGHEEISERSRHGHDR